MNHAYRNFIRSGGRGLSLTGILLLTLMPAVAAADVVRETPISRAAERHLPDAAPLMVWSLDPEASTAQAGDRLETVEVDTLEAETVKLTDVVPPIYFESGVARIPDSTVAELRAVLENMRDRHNVRVNLVGHADSQPLSARLEKVYGDRWPSTSRRRSDCRRKPSRSNGRAPDSRSPAMRRPKAGR